MQVQGNSRNSVISDPHVLMGKPVISGTRITVELILERLASGETIEQLLEAYPHLTRESIYAAINVASQAIKADVIYPIASGILSLTRA